MHPSDLPPPEDQTPAASPWPWDLDFLSVSAPPTSPPSHLGGSSEGPPPQWSLCLWRLCSMHGPFATGGSSVFSVEIGAVAYLLWLLRRHSFAYGILKGRVMESRQMFSGRVNGAWMSVSPSSDIGAFLDITGRRLGTGSRRIGQSDLHPEDAAFWRCVESVDRGARFWRQLRTHPSGCDDVIAAVNALTESLNE